MNKYLSKALIYDRRVDIISFAATTFFIYSINFAVFFSTFLHKGYCDYSVLLNLGVFLPSMFIISLVISLYSNKDTKYFHFLTEPYKKDAIAITNLLIPILSFAFSLTLYGIIATLIFLFKENSSETIGVLWSKLIFIFTILTLINSLLQFFQMIFGNYIVAIAIPLIFVFFGPISIASFNIIISNKIPFLNELFNLLNLLLDKLFKILGVIFETIGFISNNNADTITYSPQLVTEFNPAIPTLFFIFSILFMFLTIKFNRKLKAENITKIFMYKWIERMFLILVSLLSISILLFIITIFLPSLNLKDQNVLLIIDICLIPLSILVYKIVSKVWYKISC